VFVFEARQKTCFPIRKTLGGKAELVRKGLGLGREAVKQPIPPEMGKGELRSTESRCEGSGTDDGGPLLLEPAAQIGESRTVCDNIIDDEDTAPWTDFSHENGLTQDACLSVRKGMRHDVELEDTGFQVGVEMLGDNSRINGRKSVWPGATELFDRNDGIERKGDFFGL